MLNLQKHSFRLVFILFIVLFSSSCAMHNGLISSNAVLVDNQFKIVGLAIGEAESTKILGFGGFKQEAMVFAAKRDLYQHVDLQNGQALTNITVDFKREFYLFASKTKVTVTAEIVDFNENSDPNLANNYHVTNRKGIKVGDTVIVRIKNAYQKGIVQNLGIKELLVTGIHLPIEMNVKFDKIFKTSGRFSYKNEAYQIGDKIKITSTSRTSQPGGTHQPKNYTGKVLGVSDEHILVIDESKNDYHLLKRDSEKL